MNQIIVVGSLNMDLTIQSERIPSRGETIHGSDFLMNEGGKGGNQAVAAAKSGVPTTFIGSVGDDVFGTKIQHTLEAYGINTSLLQTSRDTPTGIAMIIRSGGDNRIILNSGANFCIDPAVMKQSIAGTAVRGDILITQFENEPDTVFAALQKARELGMYTILNPAPAKAFPMDRYPLIDLIIVNQSECETLTGIYPDNQEDCRKALAVFKERGTSEAIITLGSQGSTALQDNEFIFIPAYHVKAIDTTAAGDSFIGALASRLARGESMAASMQYATKAAALTVTRKGAQSSIPYIKDIESFTI